MLSLITAASVPPALPHAALPRAALPRVALLCAALPRVALLCAALSCVLCRVLLCSRGPGGRWFLPAHMQSVACSCLEPVSSGLLDASTQACGFPDLEQPPGPRLPGPLPSLSATSLPQSLEPGTQSCVTSKTRERIAQRLVGKKAEEPREAFLSTWILSQNLRHFLEEEGR